MSRRESAMSILEQQARELLSEHYDAAGYRQQAGALRLGLMSQFDRATVAAVVEALVQRIPEGYALVPIESTSDMDWAATDIEVGYATWAGSRDCCTTGEASAIWSAMLAARPKGQP